MTKYHRGDIWEIDFRPARRHEQDKIRPGLIISEDQFNNSSQLVIAIPISSKARYYREKLWPTYVMLKANNTGLKKDSYIQCEPVRSLSHERLRKHLGAVDISVIYAIEKRLIWLLGL